MRKILLVFLVFFIVQWSNSQEVKIKNDFFAGYRFYQEDKRISWQELFDLTESNSEAHQLIKSAKSYYALTNVLAVVSGGLIGYPIGQSVADNDPNWTLAYIGAGVGIVGLTFTITSSKRIKKGIKIYNDSFDTSSTTFEPTIEFVANTNGIGFSLRF